ncbi:MAG: hypothetical protein NVSMB14_10040 [Isosphaeraceae bacterium]
MKTSNLVERFSLGATLMETAVAGLTAEQWVATPGPGSWSIAQVVVHLLDCDLVYADRMKRIVAEEAPTLLAFDQDRWVDRLQYAKLPGTEAAALFAAHRRWMTVLLRSWSDADFGRSGTHSEVGRHKLAEVVAIVVTHLDLHLRLLYAKRANLGVSIVPKYANE